MNTKDKARKRRRAEIARIRAAVTNPNSMCPDMSRADGMVLLDEIDRLTKLLQKIPHEGEPHGQGTDRP